MDIKLGMVAGRICGDCREKMLGFGIDVRVIRALEAILERTRSEAIGRGIKVSPRSAFIVMRYTERDENSRAYVRGIAPGIRDAGIELNRADTMRGLQLFDIVKEGIERSRFIVVKPDVRSLNVYFELGLAVSLGKDVLIVVEKDELQKIPSDLKDWRCLTYEEGKYADLRRRVSDWFARYYHLHS